MEYIDYVVKVICTVAHCVDAVPVQIELIVVPRVLGGFVVEMAFDPVYREFCEWEYLRWLVVHQLMTGPYYFVIFVDDVASLIEQVALRIHLAAFEIAGHELILLTFTKNNLLGVPISLKDSNNVFDVVFPSLIVEELPQLALVQEL